MQVKSVLVTDDSVSLGEMRRILTTEVGRVLGVERALNENAVSFSGISYKMLAITPEE